jgi:hypothetical protein
VNYQNNHIDSPPRPHPLYLRSYDFEAWARDHERANEAIERKLAYPDAVELLCELEERVVSALMEKEMPTEDARNAALAMWAKKAVEKWLELREKQREI